MMHAVPAHRRVRADRRLHENADGSHASCGRAAAGGGGAESADGRVSGPDHSIDDGRGSSTISYDTPAAEGGQAPVTVACEPASGGTFAIGTAEVRCTATDSLNRTGACVFPVTVSRIPILSKTRFLAFGDSLTTGTTTTVNPSGSPPYLFEDLTDAALTRTC